MIPFSIIGFPLSCLYFNSSRAHIKKKVEISIQEFYCKEIHFGILLASGILPLLGFTMSEKNKAIGLCSAEVKRDRPHSLGVPLRQANVGLGIFKIDWIQCGYILTCKFHLPVDFHFCVANPCQTR
uniref:Uncharacterized protein n=1 Tax=Pseudonaja textilis TaxID=8673 RepID=A0A670YCM8_PSETE